MLETHCFDIFLDEKRISLTSYHKGLSHGGIYYLPNSGLEIVKGIFNDSAQNAIDISGVFEEKGITKKHDIAKAKIVITFINAYSQSHVYYVSKFVNLDLNFLIKAKTISAKLNQSLLNYYSPNCRADFGDCRCGVDKDKYSKTFKIVDIEGRVIKIDSIQESGYYSNGSAKIGEQIYKILSHKGNSIILDKSPTIKCLSHIHLTPGCDKSFETCCNKFGNSVNFRGEPFIPSKIIPE